MALYPRRKTALDQLLASELAAIPGRTGQQQGISVGQAVAARLITMRAKGSAVTPQPFVLGTQPGDYQPTPPKFPAPAFTNWGHVTPFVLNSAAQLRPAPPPALTSQAYVQALDEVKSLGQNTSTTRTSEQTLIGKFWAGPIWNTWNEIAEHAALAHHSNLETTAHLFAVLNLSFADSTIAFYDAKYSYQLWRPVTAIRQTDPTWTPLAPTAPDPSYPSAHGVMSGAGAAVLSAFFGNQDAIRVTSDVMLGAVGTFASYSAVTIEAGLSRIYAGQYTRIDVEVGTTLGQSVAQFVLHHIAG